MARRRRLSPTLARVLPGPVYAWLQEQAGRLHAGDESEAVARYVKRAYQHAHPEAGPCAKCKRFVHYHNLDRLCDRCAASALSDQTGETHEEA